MSEVKSKKLTATQFAKLMGVTDAAVFRAIKAGRFVRALECDASGRYWIDPDIGQVEWSHNKRRVGATAGTKQKKIAERIASMPTTDDEGDANAAITEHERRLKHYQAEIARLKFEEQSGRLLDAEAVKRQAFKVSRSVRDAMLNIPARVSAELAAEKNEFEITKRLEEEIRSALSNLSEEIMGEDEETEDAPI